MSNITEKKILAGLKEFKRRANTSDRDSLAALLAELDERYNMMLSENAYQMLIKYANKNRSLDVGLMMRIIQSHTTGNY